MSEYKSWVGKEQEWREEEKETFQTFTNVKDMSKIISFLKIKNEPKSSAFNNARNLANLLESVNTIWPIYMIWFD